LAHDPGRALSDRDLLDVADAAASRAPTELARTVLGDPDCDLAELDTRLLELHSSRFGSRLEAVASCSACGELLELTLEVEALRPRLLGDRRVAAAGLELEFRLPTTDDLAAIASEPEAAEARAALVERCVVAARRGEEPIAARELPDEAVAALAERMAEADPLGGSRVALECPACGERSEPAVDVAWFVGRELAAEAARIAGEVHALASAYGWTEAVILGLPRARRDRYLELVGA
jgi:hypothetical protein